MKRENNKYNGSQIKSQRVQGSKLEAEIMCQPNSDSFLI